MGTNPATLAAHAFLDAFRRADSEAMEALLAPDFVLRQADGLPYGGVYRGVEGWRQLLARFGETWSSLVPTVVTLVGEGPQFGVLVDIAITAKATGKALNTTIFEFWTMRDGRIAEIRPFYWDTAAVRALVS
jgi:hypothetical protein